jgi:CyaY protein
MRDSEFIVLADQALADIEQRIDASGVDLDYSMISDGVLEIEFGDGGQIVVNRHVATQEIWVAGRSGGFHFRRDKEAWKGTKDGRELMAVLSEMVSIQAGNHIDLCSGN